MNAKYWKEFYKKGLTTKGSSFATAVLPLVKGGCLIDLGCGNGRDTRFFKESLGNKVAGIDAAYGNSIEEYIEEFPSPKFVYARFLWHAITPKLQRQILDWTKEYIFIEARTTDDAHRPKVFPKHDRNFVDVSKLVKDLKDRGFQIIKLEEGTGFSKFKGEDPYLVRVIARK